MIEPDPNLLDNMCRTVSATIEMFPHATRVEIVTNTLDGQGHYAGALIVSATRTTYEEPPIVGFEQRDSLICRWNKDASDDVMFGEIE